MKKLFVLLVVVFSVSGFAQFKDSGFPTADIKDGILAQPSSSLFGFINPDNFQMKQSYSLSYSSFGNQGLALGVYTNSMMYKFNNNLNVQLDASIIHTPYSTLGKQFNNSLNGIYISKAAVNYQPWKNFSISIQYRNLPYNYYSPYSYYGGYNYGFFNGFDNNDSFFNR
ncbi:MAG: hypothetical protein M1480_01785 [Bacteroidetes bacterium]|nr:hypothetical protein [Bacteroidota bacterium]